MRGNSHVQFLGGDGVVMHCLYPTLDTSRTVAPAAKEITAMFIHLTLRQKA